MNLNQSKFEKQTILMWTVLSAVTILMSRVLPHPPNFAPVNALCLISGLVIGHRLLTFVIPLVTIYVSDFIINNTVGRPFIESDSLLIFWSDFMWGTYLAYGTIIVFSLLFLRNHSYGKMIGGSLLATLLFFVITNGVTWYTSPLYPQSFAGLIACYGLGLEFILNPTLGDLFFTLLLYSTVKYTFPRFVHSGTPQSISSM